MPNSLLEQLKRDEGLRLRPYQDSLGKLTIGVGRNLDDVGITEAEANYLLQNDIDDTQRALGGISWWAALDAVRQEAISNMAFNMGMSKLLEFHDMIYALTSKDYDSAARAMLNSVWATQVGARATRLSVQMVTGVRQ